jgi:ATP-binding cassette, subfamily B, bacterial
MTTVFKQTSEKIRRGLYLGRALGLVWKSGPNWMIANAGLLAIQGILPAISLYLMKLLVDTLSHSLPSAQGGAIPEQVIFLLAGIGGAAFLASVCRSLEIWISEAQSQSVTDHVHDLLQCKAMSADLAYYENSSYYDTLHRAMQEAPYRPSRIVNGLVQLVQSTASLLAVAVLLLTLHWFVAFLLLGAVLPAGFVRLRYADTLYRWYRERTPRERKASYLNWLLTSDSHAKEIRLFDLGERFRQGYLVLRRSLREEKLAMVGRHALIDLLAQSVSTAAAVLCYTYVIFQAVQGVGTLGDLFMYFLAFQRAQGFLQDALSSATRLYEDTLFLTHFYEFLDLPSNLVEPQPPQALPEKLTKGIAFEGVSFRYPDSPKLALDNVTFAIPAGQTIAFVGENGSGKSTLVKLLCRLYDPTGGRITLDGADLRCFSSSELRSAISAVFQDFGRYHLSAGENIALGSTEAVPPQRIIEAAQAAGVDQLISSLGNGYETLLGKWFEQGTELSVGQWQKVALARAFLRDCPIIILDEPTSAIDVAAEEELFEGFCRLMAGRTAILISHRLSNVKSADCIFVLEHGQLVEQGDHNTLMTQDGVYARLFNIQARHYI